MKPDSNVCENMKLYRELKFRHFMSLFLLWSLGRAMSTVMSMKEISRKEDEPVICHTWWQPSHNTPYVLKVLLSTGSLKILHSASTACAHPLDRWFPVFYPGKRDCKGWICNSLAMEQPKCHHTKPSFVWKRETVLGDSGQ